MKLILTTNDGEVMQEWEVVNGEASDRFTEEEILNGKDADIFFIKDHDEYSLGDEIMQTFKMYFAQLEE